MSSQSAIEWTDATWNPVRGCAKISPGCKHCYAETFAERFRGVKGRPYEQGFDMRLVPEKLAEPLRWRTPKMIFVNSMSDLFHDRVPNDYIVAVARVMIAANWHTYQVLTKRSERLRKLLNSSLNFASRQAHIWWGVSVEGSKIRPAENRRFARRRCGNSLSLCRAVVRRLGEGAILRGSTGSSSGVWPGARPMKKEWVISLRNQCREDRIPFFFKQWGGVRKATTGRRLEGRTYDEFPRQVQNPIVNAEACQAMASEIENVWRSGSDASSSRSRILQPAIA